MKFPLTRAACFLPLVLVLAGCAHKTQVQNQPMAPPVEDTPLPKPNNAPANLPPPVVRDPNQQPAQTANTQPAEQPKPVPKHPKKPKPQTTTPATTAAAPAPMQPPAPAPAAQQASNTTPNPAEVSAIGQLSSGQSSDERARVENALTTTEHGLNNINRKLSDDEEKTAAQIKEYIKQAKAALNSNDLDGAQTLATKAKLLLNELTTQ